MMKKGIYIGFSLLIIAAIWIGAMINRRLSKANPQIYYEINVQPEDSLLRIGIIGDSWASQALQYELDKYMDSSLYRHRIKSRTFIKGEPGAKTKAIYLNMFSDDSLVSTKHIIQAKPRYCIVFGGINDLHGQYGQEFYKYHILLIAETLLHYGITPIIIEIPFFYNSEQYKIYPFARQMGYRFLSFIMSRNFHTDNIALYRKIMEKSLAERGLVDKIIYISTDSILKSNKEVYIDNMHINQQGYLQLANLILEQLIKDITQNQES